MVLSRVVASPDADEDMWQHLVRNARCSPLKQALRQLPHQQECIPNILIGSASMQRNLHVHNACNGVDKLHDLLLQDLCGVRELAYVAKAKYGINLLTRYNRFQVAPVANVVANHLHIAAG